MQHPLETFSSLCGVRSRDLVIVGLNQFYLPFFTALKNNVKNKPSLGVNFYLNQLNHDTEFYACLHLFAEYCYVSLARLVV